MTLSNSLFGHSSVIPTPVLELYFDKGTKKGHAAFEDYDDLDDAAETDINAILNAMQRLVIIPRKKTGTVTLLGYDVRDNLIFISGGSLDNLRKNTIEGYYARDVVHSGDYEYEYSWSFVLEPSKTMRAQISVWLDLLEEAGFV